MLGTTGEELEYKIVLEPAHGKAVLGPSGTVTYTPVSLFSVSDSFTYMASDKQGSSNVATVTLISPFSLTNRSSSGSGLSGLLSASGGSTHGSGSTTTVKPQTTSATFDNQRITLTTPSLLSCTRKTESLAAKLNSTAIAHSKAPKLRFASAAFYIEKGVRHTHKKTIRTRSGHKKTVIVVTYTPNATARHVPGVARAITYRPEIGHPRADGQGSLTRRPSASTATR